MKAKDIMTRDVYTVRPDTTVEASACLLTERRISGVPVLRDGLLAGIITRADIIRMLVQKK